MVQFNDVLHRVLVERSFDAELRRVLAKRGFDEVEIAALKRGRPITTDEDSNAPERFVIGGPGYRRDEE